MEKDQEKPIAVWAEHGLLFPEGTPGIRPGDVRIERLKMGDWSFGHAGMHRGIGTPECPRHLHHHHDNFCLMPTIGELVAAGIDPEVFHAKSRAGSY